MSAETGIVVAGKHLIGALVGLVTVIGGLAAWIFQSNDKATKANTQDIQNLKEHVNSKMFTKDEVDERIRLHTEPLVKGLDRTADTVEKLDNTMNEILRELSVLGERFGNK